MPEFRNDGKRIFVRLPIPDVDPMRCPSCVLLRTSDGRIFAARSKFFAWTDARIEALDEITSDASLHTDEDRRYALTRRLHLAVEAIWIPASLDQIWDLRWVVRCIQSAQSGRVPASEADELKLEQNIERALSDAFDRFVSSLDRQRACEATIFGRFSPRVYDWLRPGATRRYRAQIGGDTFPFLLPYVASSEAEAAEITAIVDNGRPIVRALAQLWDVRPGSIRSLRSQPREWIGENWLSPIHSHPAALAVVIDSLPGGLRPTTPSQWAEFNSLATTLLEAGIPSPAESPLALAWMRERLCASEDLDEGVDGDYELLSVERIFEVSELRSDANAVSGLREALRQTLQRCVDAALRNPPTLKRAADRFLAGLSYRRQLALAKAFWRALQAETGDRLSIDIAFQVGEAGWPLLPQDRISTSGLRRLHSIASAESLRQCGIRLANCLRSSNFRWHARQLADGGSFYLLVQDASTLAPLSLAELRIRVLYPTHGASGRWCEASIEQHHSYANLGHPTTPCQEAVQEVVDWLHTSEDARAHLERGLLKLRRRGRVRDDLLRAAGLSSVINASRQALGTKGLLKLVASIKATQSHREGARPGPPEQHQRLERM